LKADGEDARAHDLRGAVLERMGDRAAAAVAYREAVRLKPAEAGFRLHLGLLLEKAGDVTGAHAQLRRAVKLDPKNAAAWSALGLVLVGKKAQGEARAALARATALEPDQGLAWQALGRLELMRKRPAAAVEALQKARRLAPKDPAIAADACRALAETEPQARATVEQCHEALALEPANPLARYTLGKILVAQAKCRDAKMELGRFVTLPGVTPRQKAEVEAMVEGCVRAKQAKAAASAAPPP
jgi:Flp pilus assembly protein TadD